MKKGTFIVLYGINNLGKSTQAKKLVDRMNTEGHPTEYLKYPVYNLAPSGPMINAYLREGNPYNLTAKEAQLLYVLNRTQYEPILKQKLAQGINIIVEDYIGTGICWGIGFGIEKEFMKKINEHLLPEDLVFLFQGKRFSEAIEKNHEHETNDPLIEKVQDIHKRLGKEHNWITIDANQPIDTIHQELWNHIQKIL
ncbi:MAG: hypothetical protein GW939_00420 [Candidatus Magasanikbacteria bacterium]|uniref:Thymidylate kinase-like domain-containing protein n=1 Tax=Candidatus Magasanikbacteria bacterium CG10_big_fil_rev_8_21_14_0_10_38_6 TaxID=1974647 RepID=A0A2M6P1X8_9BACT|nr:hypothetical protein [Candidatus Magasanikbacteria bacterium]NCS72009.1 hypothetical protein [Candidatus Magasanikbacteria bacterium]PIR77694.1 MAG: hypothetical protein COU30_01050 [Candidatus Magasanikbacteria bacterium CG10_big_fil_rev_8_21_14_0_10_38_6]